VRRKWEKPKRIFDRFINNTVVPVIWLDLPFTLPDYTNKHLPTSAWASSSKKPRGRPEKDFSECSMKSKKRRVDHLVYTYSVDELAFAASLKHLFCAPALGLYQANFSEIFAQYSLSNYLSPDGSIF